ncbi:MAG: hypothetical protein KAS22_04175 [Candidatus Heimdallarchaeota archaeon]|nr:hypothetical protein [Candidatus Heimdallarchaeota archaeon]
MNKQRTSSMIILFTIIIVSTIYSSGITNTIAATKPDEIIPVFMPNDVQVGVTKLMLNNSLLYDDDIYSFIGDSIEVKIEITNYAAQAIENVSLVSPEWNLTALDYEEDDLTIAGDYNQSWAIINSATAESATYTISPLVVGTFVFPASNVTFTYTNGTDSYTLSNAITFRVLEQDRSLLVEKRILVSEDDGGSGLEGINARVKNESSFTVIIRIRNFYHQQINLTAIDNEPINSSSFVYNTTQMMANTSYLDIDETFEFSYEISSLIDSGTFIFPNCTVTYDLLSDLIFGLEEISNDASVEVYFPIYGGDDWTKKVPMLSISKYFLIPNANGTLEKRIKIVQLNTEIVTVIIEINITNTGVVTAYNLTIIEQVYNDWAFETDGVENWFNVSLSQGESAIYRYNITAKLLGSYKIEPTEIEYEFQNQETLLWEVEYFVYSNTLEITIRIYAPIISKNVEWWITVGISVGVLLLAIIPTIITFVIYSNRRKTQKGT